MEKIVYSVLRIVNYALIPLLVLSVIKCILIILKYLFKNQFALIIAQSINVFNKINHNSNY